MVCRPAGRAGRDTHGVADTTPNTPGSPSPLPPAVPDAPAEPAVAAGRPRVPLARWLLAPRTTWLAHRLAARSDPPMDARTAWTTARLQRHPDEIGYAMRDGDGERPA